MEVKLKAYAKINLTLDLTGILPNKYHGIFTCMQSVGLYDPITVKTGEKGLSLRCSERYIPCDDRNTAYKAARLFYEKMGLEPECDIYIKKVIPSGAGLAGGSADAAAVLKALNTAYPGKLSHRDIMSIAFTVGADVPFCYVGGTKLCQNIGEVMSSLPPLISDVLIVKPYERVSTKDAYARFDSATNITHPDNDSFLFYAAMGDYKEAVKYAENMFETLSDVTIGEEIKETMNSNGAWFSSMSGSGSAYYGLFSSKEDMKKCVELLRGNAENVFICSTKSRGVE
ncbi:MAG: 4-(cytidine 5'-diphospho)-2-C-methyl-D-erythritol kinase [Clostridia bacterium]|nr:4-(cytidine 5'-diphospho)-2-C-methyl-D-erythritol kinase [Clostridia bacterium]